MTNTMMEVNMTMLNGTPIVRVSFYKYLGLWINDKLYFKKHIDEITLKSHLKSSL